MINLHIQKLENCLNANIQVSPSQKSLIERLVKDGILEGVQISQIENYEEIPKIYSAEDSYFVTISEFMFGSSTELEKYNLNAEQCDMLEYLTDMGFLHTDDYSYDIFNQNDYKTVK